MEKPQMKLKKKKKKADKLSIWATIVSIIAVLGLVAIVIGLVVLILLLKNKPTLNIKDFDSQESSVVYDTNGNEIGDLGATIRENISYEQLPNVVVDAFVSVEDSRFFEHNGFDVPRFTKAMLANIRTLSFGQGGSTFTMQLCKNTYFVDDETGTNASRSGVSGIKRKVQEIALAMELEHIKSKKSILSDYINILNYGGSGNIRGIQKASQFYFQKDVEELNISEAALLAGVINAPSLYNPFNDLESATERRNEVLYLMNYHGYISDQEYELAKSIKVENLLKDPYSQTGDATPYQAYLDAVVEEVYELTGLSPYSTTMHIYTYMIPEIQDEMDKIQAGDVDGYFEYPDEWFEVASICLKNDTGEIVGILGGRNYAEGGALLLNHATAQYKQPGSSIKPIVDYALAFENLGWATSHVLTDKPIFYGHEDIVVENYSGGYTGDITLSDAVGNSINTTAIQTLQQVIAAKGKTGDEYVVDYLQSIGYDVDLETFDIQFAIGGAALTATPEQMAGAYAMLMNSGKYIEPHCVARIEFANGKSPITPTYESKQILSESACYLMDTLLKQNVDKYPGSYPHLRDDYPVYAKTGTTDWAGSDGAPYGIPSGANKDAWIIACTSDYSTATWTGYEKATSEHQSYIKQDVYNQRIQARIANLILDKTVEVCGKPKEISKPEGVSTIRHILGTYPYASVIDGMDEKFIANGLVKTGATKLVSPVPADVSNIKDSENNKISANVVDDKILISWDKYPDEDKLKVAEETYEYTLTKAGEVVRTSNLSRIFDYSWLYGPIQYKANITIKHVDNTETTKQVASDKNEYELEIELAPGDKIEATLYYGYESTNVESNKISKTLTIDNKFNVTFLQRFDTLAECEKWMSDKIGISVNTDFASSDSEIGTYVFKENGNIISARGTTVILDATRTYTCTYLVEKEKTILLTSSVDGNPSVGETITITATTNGMNNGDNVYWYSTSLHINETKQLDNNVSTYSITASTAGTYRISATCRGVESYIDITFEEDDSE